MAHRSWCAETEGAESNERLEFLGDAVLGLVITDHLYRTYPDLPEGELAKVRASLVNSEALAEVAADLGMGAALHLGKGEAQSGGREKPSILADAMEAVLAATYLDGGWDAAYKLVMSLLGERIAAAAEGPGGQDYKTR
ncbi:MAG: ribonuclease III family protein, partial [Acidimicrobiales bacterium]